MMTNRTVRLVPYGRSSREKGRSRDAQQREYRGTVEQEFAGQKNVRLLPWRFDHGKTGGRLAGRDGLADALRAIQDGAADGLLVPQADRLGRNLAESVAVIYALREGTVKAAVPKGFEWFDFPQGGAYVVALNVPGYRDPDSDSYKFALGLYLLMAEQRLDEYRRQWRERSRQSADVGGYIGAAPLGYRKRDHEPGIAGGLEADPAEADRVREAFRLVITSGLAAAAAHLGLPPSKAAGPPMIYTAEAGPRKRGAGPLRNPIYLGRTTWREGRSGAVVVVNDAHEALVDAATWWRVQAVLDGDDQVPRRGASERYPLSKVATCARCQTPLVGSTSLGRRMYRCGSNSGTRGARRCGPFANLPAGDLETYVRGALAGLVQASEDAAGDALGPALGGYVLDGGPPPPDDGPATAAFEAAQRDLDQTRAADLPDVVKGAALAAAEQALAAAQEALEAATAPQATPYPEAWEVLQAAPAALPGLLATFGVSVVVSPERGDLATRVALNA